jgi:hypothetical protein
VSKRAKTERLRLVEETQEGTEVEVRGGLPPFTAIKNQHLDPSALSFKAIGLLCYMLSKPPGWKFSSQRIAKEALDGVTAIRSAQKELEAAGVLEIISKRKKNGTFYKVIILHADRAFGNVPIESHRG